MSRPESLAPEETRPRVTATREAMLAAVRGVVTVSCGEARDASDLHALASLVTAYTELVRAGPG